MNVFVTDQLMDVVVAFRQVSCFLGEIKTDVDGAIVLRLQFEFF